MKNGKYFLPAVKWTGDNLEEVLHFTGVHPKFEEWFGTFENFEKYVREHNNIFKIFYGDGSHVELEPGYWIVRFPNGNLVPVKLND